MNNMFMSRSGSTMAQPSDPPMPIELLATSRFGHRHRRRTDYGKQNGKKERRAPFRRDNMARGAKPQHEMTYSERVKASSKGDPRKRMNASKPGNGHRPCPARASAATDATRRRPRHGCSRLRDARLDRAGHGVKMQAPTFSSEAQAASPPPARRRSGLNRADARSDRDFALAASGSCGASGRLIHASTGRFTAQESLDTDGGVGAVEQR